VEIRVVDAEGVAVPARIDLLNERGEAQVAADARSI
jgi:hypothetical protein